LSRCQRFDLKRVSIDKLCSHLKNISDKESGKISEDAIKLIARTSEGSVRDAISLLDRALISQSISENNLIEEINVREMLGLADRSKIISLFKEVLSGKEKEALKYLRELINDGIDAKNFLNDILEVLYLFSRSINLGSIEKDMTTSETEVQMVNDYSKNIDMQDIGLFWQLTIKTIDDLRIVGNENLTLEMYIMQLVHLKNIENKKEIYDNNVQETDSTEQNNLISENKIEENLENNLSTQIKNQLKNTDQIKKNPIKDISPKAKVEIKKFQDLIDIANKEKEVELKFDLERNVKLVSFNKGKIDISFNEKLNQSFIKNLTEKLLLWTGERWIISLSKNSNAKSIYEQNMEKKSFKFKEFEKSDLAKQIKESFPDAELIDIQEDNND
jgi:DNA polymerase-3 subunit gamma/tau